MVNANCSYIPWVPSVLFRNEMLLLWLFMDAFWPNQRDYRQEGREGSEAGRGGRKKHPAPVSLQIIKHHRFFFQLRHPSWLTPMRRVMFSISAARFLVLPAIPAIPEALSSMALVMVPFWTPSRKPVSSVLKKPGCLAMAVVALATSVQSQPGKS